MKIVSWNTNSRSNKETLKEQCKFLDSGNFDVITLQEITENSQSFFKNYYKDLYVASSFDLSKDLDQLKRKRKYGELIISKTRFETLDPYRINIPFPETPSNYPKIGCHSIHEENLAWPCTYLKTIGLKFRTCWPIFKLV